MTRIKKRGLDYFPMDADFTRQSAVRRIMKREGEGAAVVLIDVLCAVYSIEGYYARIHDYFYEDIAAGCYERGVEDVKRIVALAIDYGLFDAAMFMRHGILTSVEIQQQFLHCTRRRVNTHIVPEYLLVDDVDAPEVQPERARKSRTTRQRSTAPTSMSSALSVTFNPENATSEPHSIAEQSKNTPLQFPLEQGEGEEENNASPRMDETHQQPTSATLSMTAAPSTTGTTAALPPCTTEAIDQLQPPTDGLKRNYDGLLLSLRLFRIPPNEQYAIIRKSNFGVIGHPVWKGISSLHNSKGKIKMPGRYLLSMR